MKRTMNFIAMTLASLTMALAGCAGPKAASAPVNTGVSAATLSGKVVETMDGGGYTYICLEKDGKKTWAALPTTKVKVGEEIKILGGAVMPQFSSKALNRTFDEIVFSAGLDQGPQAAPPVAEKQTEVVEKPVLSGKIVETMLVGSYTYLYLEGKDGRKGWSAVPITEVKQGEEIELIPGIDMVNFRSNILKRTFGYIHFSAGVKGAKEKAEKAAAEEAAREAALPESERKAKEQPKPELPPITGKVLETSNAGGYTYVLLEKDNVKTWAAVPAMRVTVGEELTLPAGNMMNNFFSKSLNRTFEKIIFTGRPRPKNHP